MHSVRCLSNARRPLALIALPFIIAGCHKNTPEAAAPPKPKPKPEISQIDLKSYKPNETGAVMILMYHRINPKEPNIDLNRTPEQFRQDLEDLYKRGYRPATVNEFVENRMDVPAGKTPVVLTFDDALPTQFKVISGTDGQPHIDPDCAVGILETFSKKHADWPVKSTFFVLPKEGKAGTDPFGQPESIAEKFDYLLKHGCEIANHTSTHPHLWKLSAEKVQWEIATAYKDIKQIAPAAKMSALALPYGEFPRKAALQYLKTGSAGGTQYEMRAVVRAAWRPVLSPVSKPNHSLEITGGPVGFNPMALERIHGDPRHANEAGTFEYWLKYFDEHPGLRYVSDGNPDVVAVPKSLKSSVDEVKVKKSGKILQLYSFSGSSGKGSGLSVQ